MPSPELSPSLQPKPPLVVILGPTGVGKTEIAIQLAERLNGEIVSADLRTFYRGLDIGTAKPSPDERERVRHHLVDVADPQDVWSLAVFQQKARQAIAEIHSKGKLPFLVGGAGQYITAVLQDWQAPAVKPSPDLRLALERWAAQTGAQGLHDRLRSLDPQAAQGIDYRNLRRTIRALEVILSSGRRFSEQRRSGDAAYRTLVLGLTLPRPELYARIDARIDAMLQAGWVDEVRRLLEQGYSPELPGLSAIGYKQIGAYLRGEMTMDEAILLIRRQTRIFVRRQANWFKPGDPAIHWFENGPACQGAAEQVIRQWSAGQESSPTSSQTRE